MISAGWLILARISRLTRMRNTMFSSAGRHQRWRITIFSTPGPTMCWLMASAWASSFTATWKNPGKNNQILDTHYQKYANDQMYQDRLTKLPNRRFLEIFGMEEVAKLRLAKKQPVCMTLNIAGMSVYNNLYGLKKGDLLLRELSEVLVSETKWDMFTTTRMTVS